MSAAFTRPRFGIGGTFPRSGIGIAICEATLTVSAVRRNVPQFTGTLPRDSDRPLETQISAALDFVPQVHQRLRRRVAVAVGDPAAQVKCLGGLPTVPSRVLRNVVAAGAPRFFRSTSGPLMTAGVRPSPKGVWAAAYARDLVLAVRSGCAVAGVRHVTLLPMVATLGTPGLASTAVFDDCGVETRAQYDVRGCVVALERRLVTPSRVHTTETQDATKEGADPSADYTVAASVGAVLHANTDPLALRVNVGVPRTGSLGIGLASVACLFALTGALAAPGLIAAHRSRVVVAKLREMGPDHLNALRAQVELGRATRGLAELTSFDGRTEPVSLLIARIANVLPRGSALVMLQIDTSGGSAVVVGPRAADLIEAFEHVPGILAPTIVGPIAPDRLPVPAGVTSGDDAASIKTFERVTIRFQRVAR